MDRSALEPVARNLMTMACNNLRCDGYVAFAVMLLDQHEHWSDLPVLIE